jgi:hypothetical protein
MCKKCVFEHGRRRPSLPSACLFPRSVSSWSAYPLVCLFPSLYLPLVCLFPQPVSSPGLSLPSICQFPRSISSPPHPSLAPKPTSPGEDAHRASCRCIHPIAVICMRQGIRHLEEPTLLPDLCAGHPVKAPVGAPEPRLAQSPLAHERITLKKDSPTQTKKLRACLRRRTHVPVFDLALSSVTWLLAASLSRASRDALQWRRLSIARGS